MVGENINERLNSLQTRASEWLKQKWYLDFIGGTEPINDVLAKFLKLQN